jgi:hypothetical protein
MASELSRIALPWGQQLFGKCSDLPGAFEKWVSAGMGHVRVQEGPAVTSVAEARVAGPS